MGGIDDPQGLQVAEEIIAAAKHHRPRLEAAAGVRVQCQDLGFGWGRDGLRCGWQQVSMPMRPERALDQVDRDRLGGLPRRIVFNLQ